MAKETLTITDNRTGKTYEVPVTEDTIKALDLKQIHVEDGDFGLMTYDPAFMNTASCRSAITYIDGDKGILRYRGYPIEQLAESSNFLETSYLLIYGELPTADQLAAFDDAVRKHTLLHEEFKGFFSGFPRDAHPMPVLSSAVSALSTFYQDSLDPFDAEHVEQFCPWSACRMNSMSSTLAMTGSTSYGCAGTPNVIRRKFST